MWKLKSLPMMHPHMLNLNLFFSTKTVCSGFYGAPKLVWISPDHWEKTESFSHLRRSLFSNFQLSSPQWCLQSFRAVEDDCHSKMVSLVLECCVWSTNRRWKKLNKAILFQQYLQVMSSSGCLQNTEWHHYKRRRTWVGYLNFVPELLLKVSPVAKNLLTMWTPDERGRFKAAAVSEGFLRWPIITKIAFHSFSENGSRGRTCWTFSTSGPIAIEKFQPNFFELKKFDFFGHRFLIRNLV